MRRFALAALLIAFAHEPALAKDEDKDKDKDSDEIAKDEIIEAGDFDEDGEEPAPERLKEDDSEEKEEPKADDDFTEDEESPELDFGDEDDTQETVAPRGPGEDTAQLYRDMQKKVKEMNPDEELIQWESYLAKYPKSLFRDRIDVRMEELGGELFGERVPGSDKGARTEDAALRQLNFALPIQYVSNDPRSHLQAWIEIGLPNHFGPRIDFEYAFLRELSAHAGFLYDSPAWAYALVVGGKYALIKSARTGTLLTGLVDAKIYTGPTSVGLRPGIGFGQRLDVLEGLDLQLQVATDLELRDPFATRYFAGLGAELRANQTVSAFVEGSINVKYVGSEELDQPFDFMLATFGLKFNASKPKDKDGKGRLDVGLGANTPFHYKYWGFYQGAVSLGADWYL